MKSQFLLLFMIGFFATGEARKCYLCSSDLPPAGCNDPFDKSASTVTDYSLDFTCTKLVLEYKDHEPTIWRYGDSGWNIALRKSNLSRDILPISETYHYCYEDFCNGASSITAALSTLMLVIFVLISTNQI